MGAREMEAREAKRREFLEDEGVKARKTIRRLEEELKEDTARYYKEKVMTALARLKHMKDMRKVRESEVNMRKELEEYNKYWSIEKAKLMHELMHELEMDANIHAGKAQLTMDTRKEMALILKGSKVFNKTEKKERRLEHVSHLWIHRLERILVRLRRRKARDDLLARKDQAKVAYYKRKMVLIRKRLTR